MIIAIGESSFWLAYFDSFPTRAQQLLSNRSGDERIALARDVYPYLHLPMVAGIVLLRRLSAGECR